MTLKDKRVLVVGRDYFFYTREIVGELQDALGASAAFIPIEPSGLAYKVLKKRSRAAAQRRLQRHHRAAIAALAGRTFDIVLFIQVHQIGEAVQWYRDAFPSARFVLYYWDSLKTHDYLPYARHFDKVVTFDPADAARHAAFGYLPLFYCERFRELRRATDYEYELSFVGTAVSLIRYEQLERFRAWAREAGVSFYDYVLVSPLFYLKMLLCGRRLRGVHFRSLSERELLQVYARSKAVLDLPNNIQSGFTMRTFESLGAHRKLITTNRNAEAEDFFTPQSVFVLDVHGTYPSAEFMAAPLSVSPAVESYSLRSWIIRLLAPVPSQEN